MISIPLSGPELERVRRAYELYAGVTRLLVPDAAMKPWEALRKDELARFYALAAFVDELTATRVAFVVGHGGAGGGTPNPPPL